MKTSILFLSLIFLSGCNFDEYNPKEKEIIVEENIAPNKTILKNYVLVNLNDTNIYEINSLNVNNETVCVFSIGSIKSTDEDFDSFISNDIGAKVHFKPSEKWININSNLVLENIESRIDKAYNYNCKYILFNRVDEFEFFNGFNITIENEMSYIKELIKYSRQKDFLIGAYYDDVSADEIRELFDFII